MSDFDYLMGGARLPELIPENNESVLIEAGSDITHLFEVSLKQDHTGEFQAKALQDTFLIRRNSNIFWLSADGHQPTLWMKDRDGQVLSGYDISPAGGLHYHFLQGPLMWKMNE